MSDGADRHPQFVQTQPSSDERFVAIRRVTVVGAVVNLLLSVAKVIAGLVGHSQALIADGIHSLSDLVTDGMVLYASKHGSKEADEDHPYGHARIETAMTVGLGLVLIAVAIGIAFDATRRLFHPEALLIPSQIALWGALVSILAKEALYRYTLVVARRIRSNLLKANAWHHRSDAASSVVVLVGVGGTMAGLTYLDAIAAVAVAVMIAKVGWDLGWHSLRELVDTGLDPETVEAIRRELEQVDGVCSVHQLRTRRMGSDALVDVHVLVDPKLSVSEGHYISVTAQRRLVDRFDEVSDVLVHIDPEDDEEAAPSIGLPSRHALLSVLRPRWEAVVDPAAIVQVTLHYLDGRVWVDLYLDSERLAGRSREAITAAMRASAEGVNDVGDVRVYFA